MNAEEKNTKERILEVANDLFAVHGYGGTSVREIATKAGVNLAAINYHFKNKENLYLSVFDYNYDRIKNGIHELEEKCENTADLAVEVFRFFLTNDSAVMNTFKIFLSDNVAVAEGELALDQEERFGPPGQQVFLQKISSDVGPDVGEEGKLWAMKMTFSLLVHMGVIHSTKIMKMRCQSQDDLRPEATEKAIRHSVEAHLEHLRRNPGLSII